MTRHHDHSFAFVSGTLGATFLSTIAAWTVSSVILDPIAHRDPNAVHLKSDQPASKHLFRISPIPPRAYWAA